MHTRVQTYTVVTENGLSDYVAWPGCTSSTSIGISVVVGCLPQRARQRSFLRTNHLPDSCSEKLSTSLICEGLQTTHRNRVPDAVPRSLP
jgi:hypothetical protein